MRFLLLSGYYPPPIDGGVQRTMYDVFRRFPAGEVTVLTGVPLETRWLPARYRAMRREVPPWDGSEPAESRHVRVVRRRYVTAYFYATRFMDGTLPRRAVKGLTFLLWLTELLWRCWREKPSAVYCENTYPTGALAVLAKRLFGVPYLVFVHGEELNEMTGPRYGTDIMDRVLEGADRLIANGSFTAGRLRQAGRPDRQVIIVNPAVDVELFRPDLDAGDLLSRHGLTGRKVILTVGRLTERKGHALVLAAMPEVLREVPEAHYVMVGFGVETLRETVERLGLSQHVSMVGHVESLPEWYVACDVFVMANHETPEDRDVEGFGMVFLEAAACGKPVVGGRSGGVVESVADGETGLLVDAQDVHALAAAIVRLLKDERLAAALGAAGRERAVRRFSVDAEALAIREAGVAVARHAEGAGETPGAT